MYKGMKTLQKLKRDKLWTSDFILVILTNFTMALSMYLLIVTMANYATDTFGSSTSMAGLASSIFILGAVFSRLWAGKAIERIGSKKMLMYGIVFSIISISLYFVANNIYFFLLVRVLHGIGMGISTTGAGTIVAQIIPRTRSGEGISYYSMGMVLTTAIGPLIGIFLMENVSYLSLFIFSIIAGIVSLFVAIPLKAPKMEVPEAEEVPVEARKRFRLSNYLEANALPIAFVTLIVSVAYSGILSFITSFSEEVDLVKAGSFYFLVYAITIIISRPFTGKLMDRRGANMVTYPALILFAIGMFLLSQSTTAFLLLLAAGINGLGYGNFQSIAQALAIKLTPNHRLGLANSTYFIFLDIGLGLGPFVFGFVVPYVGFKGLYLILTGVVVIGLVAYHFLYGRKERQLLHRHQ